MPTLHKPQQYPEWELDKIESMSGYATDLANRWSIAWPERVKALLASGEYLDALIRQEYMERSALTDAQGRSQAFRDILEERGLSLAPPEALPDRKLSELPGTAGRLTVQLDALDEHGKREEMTFFGLSEAGFVEMLPHAMAPKPDALYRGDYRYDVEAQAWRPIDKPVSADSDIDFD
jgi:hypothetical protein